MDRKKYVSALYNSSASASSWRFVCMILGFCLACLSIFIYTADKSERIIIVPPGISKENALKSGIWIKGDDIGKGYIEKLGLYYIQLLLTYHPENAKQQFEKVSIDMHPAFFSSMKAKLSSDAKRISKYSLSSVFFPKGSKVSKNSFYVTGRLDSIIGSKVISSSERTFRIIFDTVAGKVVISKYEEIAITGKGEYTPVSKDESASVEIQKAINKLDQDESIRNTEHNDERGTNNEQEND